MNSPAAADSRPAHGPALLLLLAALLVLAWGFNYVFGKLAIAGFASASASPALAAIAARMILAAAVMLLIAAAGWGRGWIRPVRRQDFPRLVLLGLSGVTLNQYFFVLGLKYTSVAHAALIFALTPVCVLLLAAAIRQEPITLAKVIGLLLCLAGVAVLMRPAAEAGASRKGDFIELLAALAFAVYTVWGKEIVGRIDTMTFTFYTYVFGGICVLPLVWPELGSTRWPQVSALGWWGVAYMVAAGSLLAYWIYYDLMKSLSAAQVSALSYLEPVVAAFAGLWILREPLTSGLALGGGAILLGVYLAERSRAHVL